MNLMKVLSVGLLLACIFASGPLSADDFDDDEILIRLQPGVDISTINNRYDTTTVEVEVPGQTYKVRVSDPDLLDSTIAAMQDDPDLVWSDLNYFGETPEGSRRTLAVVDTNPNPSEYTDQQVLQRIKAAEAHAYSTGEGVIVAVIDTGVDYNHPDLTNHMLRDPNTNAVIGWDFVDGDADPMDITDGLDNDNDGQTDEGAGHGTHVAGIIALIAPGAKILPLRVLDTEGVGTADQVAKAIRFVIHNVAGNSKVINLSLGITNIDRAEVIHDVIDEEIEGAGLPISVVASAGNEGLEEVHYPASEGDVLSISAVGANDKKADFSNYKDVDVAAPGVGIYSTYLNGGFATWDGTSMAAPFVSGEVALIKAMEGGLPRSPDAIEDLVEAAVDKIDKENPDVDVGSGRINLLKAVQDSSGVAVRKAFYLLEKQKLVVKVRSRAAPADVLTVEGFGIMTYNPVRQIYKLRVKNLTPMPTSVTVTSAAFGTSIQVPVQPK